MFSLLKNLNYKNAKIISTAIGTTICIFAFIITFILIVAFLLGSAYSYSRNQTHENFLIALLLLFGLGVFILGILVIKMKKFAIIPLIILSTPIIFVFIINAISGIKNFNRFNFTGLFIFLIFSVFMISLFVEIFILSKFNNKKFENNKKEKISSFKYLGTSTIVTIDGKKLIINTGDIINCSENDPQILVWLEFKQCHLTSSA